MKGSRSKTHEARANEARKLSYCSMSKPPMRKPNGPKKNVKRLGKPKRKKNWRLPKRNK